MAVVASALLLAVAAPRDAEALTFVLDFDPMFADAFAQSSQGFDEQAAFGFTGLATDDAVEQAVLAAVMDHYLNYPTMSGDASSPLPDGQQLDIDFLIGPASFSPPSNGDTDFWTINIGEGTAGDEATDANIFGQACAPDIGMGIPACVIDPGFFGLAEGTIVGSIWTDHIADALSNAGLLAGATDAELINAIAGTISHEIGHTLGLIHTGAMSANPGASAWGIMGSGATSMPLAQRLLGREFTYANMQTLIDNIGTRDVDGGVRVPEPGTLILLGTGILAVGTLRRRRRKAPRSVAA